MKVISFVTISTDGKFEITSNGEILKDWKFIDITIPDKTTITYKRDGVIIPSKILIRDRMLFLHFD